MENLRFILLLIGCVVIAGIYFTSILKEKWRRKNDAVNIQNPTIPSVKKQSNDDDRKAIADLGSSLAQSKKAALDNNALPNRISVKETPAAATQHTKPLHVTDEKASGSTAQPTPLSSNKPSVTKTTTSTQGSREQQTKDSETTQSTPLAPTEPLVTKATTSTQGSREQQTKDSGTAQPTPLAPTEPSVTKATTSTQGSREEPANDNSNQYYADIIVLHITSQPPLLFKGPAIRDAMTAAGMQYGDMKIFHYFGTGILSADEPLFSVANMYKPGSFELANIASFETKGLAIFMYPPTSIAASIVFKLFLNKASEIARSLNGELRNHNDQLLNDSMIQTLQDRASSIAATKPKTKKDDA